jgi:hypothetical protein
MLAWLFLFAFLLLAVFKSPWWWIPTFALGLQRALIWRRHHKPLWKIHDHALNIYTRAAAYEKVAAERERRAFEIHDAIALMVKQLHADWNQRQIADFVLHQLAGMHHENVEGVIKCFLARRPAAKETEKAEIRRIAEEAFKEPSPSLRVRIAIAGIVEENVGPDQRAEYLYQVVLGNY